MPKYMQYERLTAYTYTECIAMAWFEAHNILANRCRFSHIYTSFPLQSLLRWICFFAFSFFFPVFFFSVFATVCHQILSMMCLVVYSTAANASLAMACLEFVFVSHIYNTDFVISLPPFSLSSFCFVFISIYLCRYSAALWINLTRSFTWNGSLKRPLILLITCFY